LHRTFPGTEKHDGKFLSINMC